MSNGQTVGADRATHTFMDSVKLGVKVGVVAAGIGTVSTGGNFVAGGVIGVGAAVITVGLSEMANKTRETIAAQQKETQEGLKQLLNP